MHETDKLISPVVRASDAFTYVDTKGNSPLPFRQGVSCMQCHSTMDQMARTTRNLFRARSANHCGSGAGRGFAYIQEFTASESQHPNEYSGWIDEPDHAFHLRQPLGRLYYRTTKGDLINRKVSNINELGEALAENDDLYICAAKRYVKFLTGVDVPMFDPGDINAPDVSEAQTAYIEFVKAMGSELKTNGDPQVIIGKILESDSFLDPSKRPVYEKNK